MKIANMLKKVMINYGAMNEDWRIKITNVENNGTDWAVINFSITKKGKRNPCTLWNMRVNMATGFIDWERTNHVKA